MALVLLALLFALPASAADLVFEGGGERLVVPGERLVEISAARDYNGNDVVEFLFAPKDAAALHDLTKTLLGQQLDVVVCGEVLIRPTIMEPIAGGRGQISMPDQEAAQALAARLQGDADCGSPDGS
ncbi:MAG: hypothetical protein HKN18_15530 [Silicimonas sp.]|nr:hypothetical protein [Silicimonas sp.]